MLQCKICNFNFDELRFSVCPICGTPYKEKEEEKQPEIAEIQQPKTKGQKAKEKKAAKNKSAKATLPEKVKSEDIDEGIVPFDDRLKSLDLTKAFGISDGDYYRVMYEADVDESERIPGLVSFIDHEYGQIEEYIWNLHLVDKEDENGVGRFLLYFRDTCQIVLSPRKEVTRYSKPFETKDLLNLLEEESMNGKTEVSIDEVRRILNGDSIRSTRLGSFSACSNDSEGPVIYIYYRVQEGDDPYSYAAGIRNTLAHEMMHLAHWCFAGELWNDDSLSSKRVKEAVADFGGMLYSLNDRYNRWGEPLLTESQKVARNRFDSWKKRLNDGLWPYAFAYYFTVVGAKIMRFSYDAQKYYLFGSTQKLKRIIQLSKTSYDEAFNQLLERK